MCVQRGMARKSSSVFFRGISFMIEEVARLGICAPWSISSAARARAAP